MEEVNDCLDKAQNDIFTGRFKQADEEIMTAVNLLAAAANSLTPVRLPDFNKVMLAILEARQKNDYLLLADLFEFRLKPFLANKEGKRRS